MPPTESPASADPELMLKTVPPRPPYRALTRRHLDLNVAPFAGAQIVLLEAPTGWGKTALLAQWRRATLDAGGLAAWLSTGPSDEAPRLVHGLSLALERASGTPRRQAGAERFLANPLEAATAWLAFAASLPYEILVLLDDVEHLPASGASLLQYVLRNLPSNVRAVLAGHTGLRGLAAGLESSASFTAGPAQLRLTVEEACALATAYGAGADEGARLHEDTEGWPLGVQLALRARSRTQGQPDHRRIVAGMLQALAPDDRAFLVDTSICETLHPELCTALAGSPEGAARLARLVAGTPLFTEAEDGRWVRLHALARELLCREMAAWPAARRAPLHLHASAWFEERGMLPDAARHAHAAGADERAFALAERGLLDLVRSGQLDALAAWRDLLPEAELQRRPRLRLAVAWSLAVSDRPALAIPHVEALLAAGAADDELLRCELAMVSCAAYIYADDPDRFDAVFAPWAEQAPCGAGAWLQRAHANRRAALALMHGRPAQARSFLGAAGARSDGAYSARWSELLCGHSYLWQGQARLAADSLRAPVAAADAALGRRHALSTMLATVLAAASYEGGQIETAQLLLANRLDVLERSATPDLLILGHLTAARIAAVYGMEHRALDLCDALLAAGERRRLPRVCMAALAEQIRLHALRERIETCRQLYARLLAFFGEGRAQGPLWERQALLLRDTACAHLALASGDWQDMLAALEQAASHAEALQLGGAAVEIMKLRAQALDRIDGSGARLAREAAGLTRAYGLAGATQGGAAVPKPQASAPSPAPARGPFTATAAGALLLTPKEREILELLARKLSNKEIANILAVTQETVKWHLKNLFAKVEAGSRRHAISRAVMLGLLE